MADAVLAAVVLFATLFFGWLLLISWWLLWHLREWEERLGERIDSTVPIDGKRSQSARELSETLVEEVKAQ